MCDNFLFCFPIYIMYVYDNEGSSLLIVTDMFLLRISYESFSIDTEASGNDSVPGRRARMCLLFSNALCILKGFREGTAMAEDGDAQR